MNRPIQTFTAEKSLGDRDRTPASDRADTQATHMIALASVGYWLVFWAMNGLDKFLNRTDLGALVWYGKDRTQQFTGYFDRLGLGVETIRPLLAVTGVIELAVALTFLVGLFCLARRAAPAWLPRALNWGFFASAGIFIAFSLFDVVAGDRAELREHGLYLILVLVSWALSMAAVRIASAGRSN